MATPGPGTVRYGGETSCIAIGGDDGGPPTLVLDGGTGLRVLTRMLGGRPFQGALVLSHLHWDHTHGLPFFAAGDRPEGRVRLLLPEQGTSARELLGQVMSPPHFPIGPEGLQGDWSFEAYDEGALEAGDFEVRAREVPHGGGRTMGLRVSDGRVSVAFVPDHAPHFAGPGEDGLGELHPGIIELAQGVDLLVHDAQYTAGELPSYWALGHAATEYAVRLAERSGAGRLLLFHHDPGRDDDALDALLERTRALTEVAVDAAVEGDTITL
jgi:phosphoribosyl 1,2-cyclic phosphodiesterase